MRRFRSTLSFERDLRPVETVRDEVEAANFEDGIRRAVFRDEVVVPPVAVDEEGR